MSGAMNSPRKRQAVVDPKPKMAAPPIPTIDVSPSTIPSAALRLLSVTSLNHPHLLPFSSFPLAGIFAPILYLSSLPGYLTELTRRPIVEEREITQIISGGGKKRRAIEKRTGVQVMKVKKDTYIRREGEARLHHEDPVRQTTLNSLLAGAPTNSRLANLLSLLINTLLTLAVLDQTWSSRLMKHQDLTYVRTSSLTPHTASLNFRLPPVIPYAKQASTAEVIFRPLLSDPSIPIAWEHSQPIAITEGADWTGKVQLDGLSAGRMYQYKVKQEDGSLWPSGDETPLNFTTFPDPRLSRQSHFRFIHSASPREYPSTYSPYQLLKPLMLPLLPSTAPQIFPTPAHIKHQWQSYHNRQPAWRVLGDWLADMRDRSAWAQVQFGIIGDDIEMVGTKRGPMGLLKKDKRRTSRALLASRDVRDVYETLPILPSRVHSPSEGYILEPAALSYPESSFAYADTHFYRLRRPSVERSARESQDWMADINDLESWLSKVNGTTGFKFVLSSTHLNPFFGGKEYETEWRDAVLDILQYVPNIIVLSESRHGFTSSQLRKRVLEITSPALSAPIYPVWWPSAAPTPPDLSYGHEEAISSWVKAEGKVVEEIDYVPVDQLLRHIPSVGGTQWTSLEVDSTTCDRPRLHVVFWKEGSEVGRLEVVGASKANIQAVGSVAESLGSLLKRFGLTSRRWF